MWTLRDLDRPGSHLFGPAHGSCAKTLISKCARAQYLNISLPLSLILYYIILYYIILYYIILYYIILYIYSNTHRMNPRAGWKVTIQLPMSWVVFVSRNMGEKHGPKNGCVLNIPPMAHEFIGPKRSCSVAPHRLQVSERVHYIGVLQHDWDSDSARLLRRSWRKTGNSARLSKVEWWFIQVSRPVVGCRGPWLAVWKPVISLLTGCRRCVYRGSRRSGISNGSWPRCLIMLEQGRARWVASWSRLRGTWLHGDDFDTS